MVNRFAFRRRSHRVALVAAAAAVLTATAGVGSSHASTAARPQAGQIVVGLITKTDTNPFFVKMRQGAQAEANAKGVKLLTAAASTTATTRRRSPRSRTSSTRG